MIRGGDDDSTIDKGSSEKERKERANEIEKRQMGKLSVPYAGSPTQEGRSIFHLYQSLEGPRPED
jgi:hypothetical protein